MPLLRRRRPLLRAAAVGGGAYLAGKRHAQRDGEAGTTGQASEPAAPQESGMSAADMERLQQLSKLHQEGVLTDQELAEQKARILG